MRSFCLSELESPLAGRLRGGDASFDAVSSDTRTLQPGELFVALSGPSFDGHAFIERAAELGAPGALVSRVDEYPVPTLEVADTLAALGRLAALNRDCFAGKLVAITGSSGKTTAKNMLAGILETRARTLSTRGNLNNEIGVPLTLLRLQPKHEYAVIEMGASRAGDISYLCEIARPDVAVLLNAMPAHLEGFGDLAGVAAAKGEILSGLPAGGTAIINADSEFAPLWRELARPRRCLEFGFSPAAEIRACDVEERGFLGSRFRLVTPRGEVRAELPLPGRHNILNATAASAAALALGMDPPGIAEALARLGAEPGRMQVSTTPAGFTVVNDSYNANPGSVRAAVDMLANCSGRRALVLGAMAELGPDSARLHEDVGRYAKTQGIDEFWLCGAETLAAARGYGSSAHYCEDLESLARELRGHFSAGDVVLVKGSRSAGMESIVAALLAAGAGED